MILVETEDYARISARGRTCSEFFSAYSRWIWFLLGLLAASAVFLAARPYWEDSASGLKLRFGKVTFAANVDGRTEWDLHDRSCPGPRASRRYD